MFIFLTRLARPSTVQRNYRLELTYGFTTTKFTITNTQVTVASSSSIHEACDRAHVLNELKYELELGFKLV